VSDSVLNSPNQYFPRFLANTSLQMKSTATHLLLTRSNETRHNRASATLSFHNHPLWEPTIHNSAQKLRENRDIEKTNYNSAARYKARGDGFAAEESSA